MSACFYCKSTTRKLGPISTGSKNLACATCLRERKKRKREARREAHQRRTFDITLSEKADLIEFQGGGCICAPWTGYNGNSRSLSTDHDHQTGALRGALCKHCNDLLGRVRDDPEYFRRMIAYLTNPPAQRLFGMRIAPIHQEGR